MRCAPGAATPDARGWEVGRERSGPPANLGGAWRSQWGAEMGKGATEGRGGGGELEAGVGRPERRLQS